MKTFIFHCRSKVAPGAVAWVLVVAPHEDTALQIAAQKVHFSEWYLTTFPVTELKAGESYLLEENT